MLKARWKPGMEYFYKNADAQTVAKEIMSIGESASAEQIVEKAKDKKTELHKCFEWDDSKAAEMWRVHQARVLTSNLIVETLDMQDDESPKAPIRFFVKVEKTSGYKPIENVYKNISEHEALLNQALAELRTFQRKYSRLQELSEIFDAITSLVS